MQTLKTGEFCWQTNEIIRLESITLTNTEYTLERYKGITMKTSETS